MLVNTNKYLAHTGAQFHNYAHACTHRQWRSDEGTIVPVWVLWALLCLSLWEFNGFHFSQTHRERENRDRLQSPVLQYTLSFLPKQLKSQRLFLRNRGELCTCTCEIKFYWVTISKYCRLSPLLFYISLCKTFLSFLEQGAHTHTLKLSRIQCTPWLHARTPTHMTEHQMHLHHVDRSMQRVTRAQWLLLMSQTCSIIQNWLSSIHLYFDMCLCEEITSSTSQNTTQLCLLLPG